jgi:hypothetical protein
MSTWCWDKPSAIDATSAAELHDMVSAVAVSAWCACRTLACAPVYLPSRSQDRAAAASMIRDAAAKRVSQIEAIYCTDRPTSYWVVSGTANLSEELGSLLCLDRYVFVRLQQCVQSAA